MRERQDGRSRGPRADSGRYDLAAERLFVVIMKLLSISQNSVEGGDGGLESKAEAPVLHEPWEVTLQMDAVSESAEARVSVCQLLPPCPEISPALV